MPLVLHSQSSQEVPKIKGLDANKISQAAQENQRKVRQEALRISVFDMAGQRPTYGLHHMLLHEQRMVCIIVVDLQQDLDCKAIDVEEDATHHILQKAWAEANRQGRSDLSAVCSDLAAQIPGRARELQDLAEQLDKSDLTVRDRLLYWLRSVHTQAPRAPVLIIGTHQQSISSNMASQRVQQIQQSIQGKSFESQVKETMLVENDPAYFSPTGLPADVEKLTGNPNHYILITTLHT